MQSLSQRNHLHGQQNIFADSLIVCFAPVIDRRTWAECFWWGEIEQELRDIGGGISHRFMKDSDRELCMTAIDDRRKLTPYPHPPEECSEACKARGSVSFAGPTSILHIQVMYGTAPVPSMMIQ